MTNVYEKISVELPEEETIALSQITDDFTKIKGIGSGTAEKLNIRKIYTYRQLAETPIIIGIPLIFLKNMLKIISKII